MTVNKINDIPVAIINLDCHADRWAWIMTTQVSRLNLQVTRISAVDASEISRDEPTQPNSVNRRHLTPGELACLLSHRRAWQHLLDSDSSHLAVFEDDVHLADDLPDLLRLDAIPPGADIIKLEAFRERVVISMRPVASCGKRRLHWLLSRSYGAAGYIVSRRCAAFLLKLSEDFHVPVDLMLFDYPARLKHPFRTLQVVPAACVQEKNLSVHEKRSSLFGSSLGNPVGPRGKENKAKRRGGQGNPARRKRGLRRILTYLNYVRQGANPLRQRIRLPVDLGERSRI